MATKTPKPESDPIEASLVPIEDSGATLFRTDEPDEVIAKATKIATALKKVLVDRELTSKIGNKEYVRVEGWTLLGSMLGVFPFCEWTRAIEDGWEARVIAKTKDGAEVGAAEAECLRSESNWRDRDDYALRSMAQTRATAKALRLPLGFIVAMAGYNATPAEEIPPDQAQDNAPQYRTCPDCASDSVIKGKAEYGGGWVCWKKRNGCGSTFPDNDERITKQGLVEEATEATEATDLPFEEPAGELATAADAAKAEPPKAKAREWNKPLRETLLSHGLTGTDLGLIIDNPTPNRIEAWLVEQDATLEAAIKQLIELVLEAKQIGTQPLEASKTEVQA